ncbi:hypothetical protein [[Clostridium] fimetarium]|uniref:Zinc-ribbon domain-containing protein n=1 Tax=[Clostridium] fimetarium TaxID=99656 RepID=A0A1I0Q0C7_9FIRM|nr:hypothetical protein [[Clostridium] fimetarium]SEW20242.1 hypothetical protein SAMN05421659_106183 [[Clostridium] fimetarium]
MAIIECSECHGKVSDKATKCPHCGNPISGIMNIDNNEEKNIQEKNESDKYRKVESDNINDNNSINTDKDNRNKKSKMSVIRIGIIIAVILICIGSAGVYFGFFKGDNHIMQSVQNTTAEQIETLKSSKQEASTQQSTKADTNTYYTTEMVRCSSFNVTVKFAWTIKDSNWNTITVKCDCVIENITGKSIVFNASKNFALSNNGVGINASYNGYDGKTIDSNGKINTTLEFTYPSTANIDLSQMIMTADSKKISLNDKPQTAVEKKNFEGAYYRSGAKEVVIKLSDNTYQVITFYSFDGSVTYETVNLSLDNTFYLGKAQYIWYPDTYTIKSLSSDNIYTFVKK